MNLYETLGLVALGAGAGGAIGYAGDTHRSPFSIAVAAAVGITAGVIAFLRMRKAVLNLQQPTERKLAIQYVLMFLGVSFATWVTTFGTLSIAETLSR